jgi:5-formyltetrahydrofolate cyclo-ligase
MNPGAGEGLPKSAPTSAGKAQLRAQIKAERSTRLPDPQASCARTKIALAACAGAAVVAAYTSRADEPDTAHLLQQLLAAGTRVLLPVLTTAPDWAWYTGDAALVPGPRGIAQPSGARLGAGALAEADWIWLPGLAGTPSGDRLGTGGGWYDRALAQARPDARRGLLLFDSEVVHELPTDPWDEPVHLLVTELRRIVCETE